MEKHTTVFIKILLTVILLCAGIYIFAQNPPPDKPDEHGSIQNSVPVNTQEQPPAPPAGHGDTTNQTPQTYRHHGIVLNEGWSGISSYVAPASDQLESVFNPIANHLIIALTTNGIYYPADNINTIGAWEDFSAYKIKVAAPVEFTIQGFTYADKTLELAGGWNLIPVISECPVNVDGFFAPVRSKIVAVKDVSGYGVYWPEMEINTLVYLLPGKAYLALFTDNTEITFEDCGAGDVSGSTTGNQPKMSMVNSGIYLPWKVKEPTSNSHILAIKSHVIAGFANDFILGAFDEHGNCFGVSNLVNEHNYIQVFGDDGFENKKNGFYQEDQIGFKLYDIKTQQQFDLVPEFDPSYGNTSGVFLENGLSVIRNFDLKYPDLVDRAVQLFPNPCHGDINILSTDVLTNILITDIQNQVVYSSRGILQNAHQANLSNLEAGIYIVTVEQQHKKSYHKLILK